MILPARTVADTALITLRTTFTTPPTIFTTVHSKPPRSSNPPDVHVCGGVLYWTMTLSGVFGFDSNGNKSGEIFEVSANPIPMAKIRRRHRVANRTNS